MHGHLFSTGADGIRVIVACLQHDFCLLLDLQCTLMGLLQRVGMEQGLVTEKKKTKRENNTNNYVYLEILESLENLDSLGFRNLEL